MGGAYRLPRLMRARIATIALLSLSLLALVAVAGCGSSAQETTVNEGESLELGNLKFDVQITRALNPGSPEDRTYLKGAPPLQPGEEYLAVFMQVHNDGSQVNVVPYPFKIVDTRGTIYVQDKVDNPFALTAGAPVEPDSTVPGPETAARNGPIEGAMILFRIPEASTENRPFDLEVPGPGVTGEIELDL